MLAACTADAPKHDPVAPEEQPSFEIPDDWTLAPVHRRWYGDAAYDSAGRYVDMADLDGSPGLEMLVAAPSVWQNGTDDIGNGGAFVVDRSTPEGVLDEVAAFHFVGHHNGDSWGMHVAALGDVTGDGHPDVGMLAVDGGMEHHLEGVTFVVYSGPFSPDERWARPSEVAAHFVYDRDADLSGVTSLAACGDLNGDGLGDLCGGAAPNSSSDAPTTEVLVWFGPIPEIFTPMNVDLRLQVEPGVGNRCTVPAGADLDGDGYPEMVVGVPERNGDEGGLYLVSDPGEGVASLDDFPLWIGEGGRAGHAVSPGCDVDGDGRGDVFVGAPFFDGRRGRAYVITDEVGGPLAEVAHTIVTTDEPSDWLGYDGALADLDGDGACDLIVGVPRDIYSGMDRPGRVLVFYGPLPGGTLDASEADHIWMGSEEADAFGIALAAGDVDADGRDDLLVGAPDDDSRFVDGGSAVLIVGASR